MSIPAAAATSAAVISSHGMRAGGTPGQPAQGGSQRISLHRREILLGIVGRCREQVRERSEGHRGLGLRGPAWAAVTGA